MALPAKPLYLHRQCRDGYESGDAERADGHLRCPMRWLVGHMGLHSERRFARAACRHVVALQGRMQPAELENEYLASCTDWLFPRWFWKCHIRLSLVRWRTDEYQRHRVLGLRAGMEPHAFDQLPSG